MKCRNLIIALVGFLFISHAVVGNSHAAIKTNTAVSCSINHAAGNEGSFLSSFLSLFNQGINGNTIRINGAADTYRTNHQPGKQFPFALSAQSVTPNNLYSGAGTGKSHFYYSRTPLYISHCLLLI